MKHIFVLYQAFALSQSYASAFSAGLVGSQSRQSVTKLSVAAPPPTTTTGNDIDLEAWETELSLEELRQLQVTAQRAARAAGAIITSNTGCCSQVDEECEVKFNIKDVVTEYDKQAQQAVEEIVRTAYPTHSFLGEEDVESGGEASAAALLRVLGSTETGYIWICK